MSSSTTKISLWAAIIININIIIGTGIFINTTELASRAGVLGGLCYVFVGILLSPLILSFVKLLELHPNGGFYSYCSGLHPLMGFLNTWCYFFAKLSSATLSIHIFTLLIQKLFPVLGEYNFLYLNFAILTVLLALNMLNVKTGSKIQSWIMILKLFPLFFVIGIGIFYIDTNNVSAIHQLWDSMPSAIPLVLHALLGFEIACAISRNIENPRVNGPRAILISYAIVVILFVLYQTLFYTALGNDLIIQSNYQNSFSLLLNKLTINRSIQNMVIHIIHVAIALSALSASFGIIYANMWNLYTLAELNMIPFASLIRYRNYYNIPFLCVIIQGIIMAIYLVVMTGKQTTFQQLSAFGAIVTYTLSIAGLLASQKKANKSIVIPILGIFNCALLLIVALYAMWMTNTTIPLQLFAAIIVCGSIAYSIRRSIKFTYKE